MTDLAALVDAEARLDRALAEARAAADAKRAAARQRAEQDATRLDDEIARARVAAIAASEAQTAGELRAIRDRTNDEIARILAADVAVLAEAVVDAVVARILAEGER